jgi:hypothetical protein
MQNHNRPTAHVLCVFAILLTVQAAYSSAEEAKSYPVLSGVGIALKVAPPSSATLTRRFRQASH